MENDNVKVSFSLGGFSTLLTIAFVVLKRCHVINWSWVWVLAPTWISIAVSLILFFLAVIIALIRSL